MSEAFAQGWIVDVILALVGVEAVALAVLMVRTGRSSALPGMIANLLAGAFLLAALQCALLGAGLRWIALSLFAALLAHAGDLADRWRRLR